jgi:Na+/melibiose symporter-like transporter
MINGFLMIIFGIGIGLLLGYLIHITTPNRQKKTDWKEIRKNLEQPVEKYSDKKWVINFYFFFWLTIAFGISAFIFFISSATSTNAIEGVRYFILSMLMFFGAMLEWFSLVKIFRTKRYYRFSHIGKWVDV